MEATGDDQCKIRQIHTAGNVRVRGRALGAQLPLCATGRGQSAQSRAAPTRRSQGGTPMKMLATPAALVNEGRRRR